MNTGFPWLLLALALSFLGMRLGRLPGPFPKTPRELYERIRALDRPIPYRLARWALLALSIACGVIGARALWG